MKLTQKDLEQNLVNKIERLDKVISNFSESDKAGFLAYNGDEFYIRKVSDLSLKQMINYKELLEIETFLKKEDEITKNSFLSNFNLNNRANSNFNSLATAIKPIEIVKLESDIKLIKKDENYLIILDVLGNFHKFDIKKRKIEFSLDIITKVKSLFAITELYPYEINDFEIYGGGFLFSTNNNGVFYVNIEENTIEVMFAEKNIKLIKVLDQERVLLLSESGVATLYETKKGFKIESFNFLPKSQQTAKKSFFINGNIYILGKSPDPREVNLLHILEQEKEGIDFRDITGKLYKQEYKLGYIIYDLVVENGNIYLYGLKDEKVFIWKYNLTSLEKEHTEIIIDDINFSSVPFISFDEGKIYINYKERLLVYSEDGVLIKNLSIGIEKIKDMIFSENKEIIILSINSVYLLKTPEYKYEKEIMLNIYSGEYCNNLEILFISNDGKEDIVLIDGETDTQIQPSFHMTYKNKNYIRLIEGGSKNIYAKVSLSDSTKIKGVIIRANALFFK
jgi:hypothetical protein